MYAKKHILNIIVRSLKIHYMNISALTTNLELFSFLIFDRITSASLLSSSIFIIYDFMKNY